MHITPRDYYKARILAGEIAPDPAQARVVDHLHALAEKIPAMQRRRFLFWGRRSRMRGLYLYGTVGRGKSMLMDLFYEGITDFPKKRVHFHAFMLDVHARLHAAREKGLGEDALPSVARDLVREAQLLCFDEFQVYNIADAMILGRLFRLMFREGVVVVATSNCAPEDLYKDGLQRALFLPFIELIKKRLDVVAIDDGHDYRQDRLRGRPVYLTPLDRAAHAALQDIFSELTDAVGAAPLTLKVQGRVLEVPRAAKDVAWFAFAELCQRPLGAADYLMLTERFHTVIVEGIPLFSEERRDEVQRFITLIDVLYDQRTKLVASAAVAPEKLLPPTSSLKPQFMRTASRLEEMQAQDYVMAPHRSIRILP